VTSPAVSVQLAKELQPPLFDAHLSSTPSDIMYRNNCSDDDDDDDDDGDDDDDDDDDKCVYSPEKQAQDNTKNTSQ